MKFQITRSNWLRGEADDPVLLRSPDLHMCCLGFLACAVGYDKTDLLDTRTPSTLVEDTQKNFWPHGMLDLHRDSKSQATQTDSMLAQDLMDINDSDQITDEEREAHLTLLFSEIGITVEFLE